MKQRIAYAARETRKEISKQFLGKNSDTSQVLLILAIIACLIGGVFLSFKGIGGGGYLINFVAGCISSGIYLLYGYGTLIFFAFLATFIMYMKHGDRKTREFSFGDKTAIAFAGLVAVAALALGVLAVSAIPIVGKQVTFMMRDQD